MQARVPLACWTAFESPRAAELNRLPYAAYDGIAPLGVAALPLGGFVFCADDATIRHLAPPPPTHHVHGHGARARAHPQPARVLAGSGRIARSGFFETGTADGVGCAARFTRPRCIARGGAGGSALVVVDGEDFCESGGTSTLRHALLPALLPALPPSAGPEPGGAGAAVTTLSATDAASAVAVGMVDGVAACADGAFLWCVGAENTIQRVQMRGEPGAPAPARWRARTIAGSGGLDGGVAGYRVEQAYCAEEHLVDGGGASVRLAYPSGIAPCPDGSYVFCDSENRCLRRLTETYTLGGAAAGGAACGYSTAWRVDTIAGRPRRTEMANADGTFFLDRRRRRSTRGSGTKGEGAEDDDDDDDNDDDDDLFGADGGSSDADSIDTFGPPVDGARWCATFNKPTSVAVDARGVAAAVDRGRIRLVDLGTGDVRTLRCDREGGACGRESCGGACGEDLFFGDPYCTYSLVGLAIDVADEGGTLAVADHDARAVFCVRGAVGRGFDPGASLRLGWRPTRACHRMCRAHARAAVHAVLLVAASGRGVLAHPRVPALPAELWLLVVRAVGLRWLGREAEDPWGEG